MSAFSRRHFLHTATVISAGALLSRSAWCKEDNHSACAGVVQRYVRTERFQGVAALARAGRIQFSMPVGLADIDLQKPMEVDSLFGIASISKMLTSVTVLKLQERGLLRLDEPISAYLPYFRKDIGQRVTLRHLMANNSGVPNQFSLAIKADPNLPDQSLTTEQAVHRFCEGDLIFTPGERFDYSMPNWILVLAIIESVTRMTYADAMRKITIGPLDLGSTTPALDVKAVTPYTSGQPPVKRSTTRQAYMAAAGGYYSNAPDLVRAAHRIFDTRFLPAASLKELTTVEVASDQYALGGRIRTVAVQGASVQAAWDTGNTSGYRSVLGHRLDGKATVVVLNNTSMSQKTLDEFSDALLAAFG